MEKTIIDDQRIADLIEELKELKDKGVKNADYERIGEITSELYESYNPLDNDVPIRDGKVKWKIKPNVGDVKKTKIEIEFEKDIVNDDVQFSFSVNGDGTAFQSNPGDESFQVRAGVRFSI